MIFNSIDFKKNYDEINKNINNFESVVKVIKKYDLLISKFKGNKDVVDYLLTDCQKNLKKLYLNKMHFILLNNNYDDCLIYIKKLLNDLNSYSSIYFKGLITSFITDVSRVINNFDIVYKNYHQKKSVVKGFENIEFDYFSLKYDSNLDFEEENILNKIDEEINGYEFEKITKQILLKNGFHNVLVTPSSNDFGVDVLAIKDEIKYAIQCKKYSSSVGVKAVQEVIASKSIHNCHVAVVLTNNFFTKSAIKLAEKNNVLLWDRNDLIAMIDKVNSI